MRNENTGRQVKAGGQGEITYGSGAGRPGEKHKEGTGESLQEQRKFAEKILDNSAVATFVLNPRHKVVLWNKACEELTGVPAGRMIGTDNHWKPFYPRKRETLADIIIDGSFEIVPSLYHKHSRSTLISNGLKSEGWYPDLNGKKRYMLFDAAPVIDSGGKLTVVIETLQDITEQKKAEEELYRYRNQLEDLVRDRTSELLASNERLIQEVIERKKAEEALQSAIRTVENEKAKSEAIISAIGDGISIQDPDFRILYQNQIHRDLLGDQVGKYCYKVFQNSDRVCRDCPIKRSFADGNIHRSEGSVSTEKGVLLLEQTASPLKDSTGKVIAGVKVVRDITHRKKMEEELIRTEKLESLGLLSGGIAHDFNNLLSALLGNISLAKAYTDPAHKIYDILNEAEKASSRARDLTQQLLTFSKGGAPVKKIVSLSSLIKDSADFALRGSNARYGLTVEDDLWPAEVDEGQMGQVVNNLVINAQQSMPKGGTIRISCSNTTAREDGLPALKAERYVKISVEDEGIGIPRKYIDKIFDPYFTTKQKGSGLGLATAYSIIAKHEGHLTVESVPGEGTTFHIYLPASDKEVPVAGELKKKLVAGRGKILVMDDEDIIRLIVGRMLEGLGYEAEFAEHGEEAIEKYKSAEDSGRPFDAVIIDLTIRGGMGGVDCVKSLLEINPGVKAIVSSGYSEDPVMSRYKSFGFKGIIIKPYQMEDLSELLHRVLRETD